MDLPKRKSPRLRGFDYSTPGYYFITVCTKDKKCLLSRIVKGNILNNVGEGLCTLPKIQMTDIGKKTKTAVENINSIYPDVSVDKYVIMPNHIHIIIIKHPDKNHLTGGHGGPPLRYSNISIDKVIGRLKSYTTHLYGKTLWQRSFHDHIIRNDNDYKKIWEYIDTNPICWESDCFYTK